MSEIVIFGGIWQVIKDVTVAFLPLVLFFLFFQLVYLKLPWAEVINILKGTLLTFLGIVLFLQGVHVGFLPVGELLGQGLVTQVGKWFVIPVGFSLGLATVFAEPAVRALCEEVEKVSSGYIPEKVLLVTLSLGVGLAVALAMARIILGIPLMYLLIPGYGLALAVSFIAKENFVSIAFDSGGVTTGPMTVTFVMAFSVGVASSVGGRNPLIEGFGMIALVALIPVLAVLLLGLIYAAKERQLNRT
ncbi:MAG TPA: DUF1538 domain-containing protein [Firmicutes bacterium]|jgi:hypothetical protein|nr:DUF1538 domain-containing protein [Bacillota bacterium]